MYVYIVCVFGWFLMAKNHSRPVEDGLPTDIDWKIRLQPEARQRIVNKMYVSSSSSSFLALNGTYSEFA